MFISLVLVIIIGFAVYVIVRKKTQNKSHDGTMSKRYALISSFVIALLLIGFVCLEVHKAAAAPDSQCNVVHSTNLQQPSKLTSTIDFMNQGDYEYEIGSCQNAIDNYSKAIELDPSSAQAYNNRAYTNMRMRDYKSALSDLDKAISLNPDYIHALMNRADIHNFYYNIDRKSAITDYEKVISLGGEKQSSVCGHLLLAKHNGWNLGTILELPKSIISCK